ncbi:hypothetical protein PHMEG_00014535 [Phytophthora megakarya]|uniref:Uncharacterized protein n=1 Tax=Phytophthora megakarya TaxID=4795 RepID=A0A225W3J1_9STRA|nr:hypothetical protein PHMEG_00014535 [Phytophthora megakarya]
MTRRVLDMLTLANPDHERCVVLSGFWEYFERTWIDGYDVELWSVHAKEIKPIARSNDPMEQFNRVLRTRVPTHQSMATFVTTINQISSKHLQQLADITRGQGSVCHSR